MKRSGKSRTVLGCWMAVLFLLATCTSQAWALDDRENSSPTAWWIYTGQSLSAIQSTITSKSARITDIALINSNSFTVTYVKNSGAYAKAWWWYVGIDATTLSTNLATNKARLISLKAYDIGGGNIRFAAVMIANTGVDSKTWWWYVGQSAAQVQQLLSTNNARLTSLQSYSSNGKTVFAVVMISNTGADKKAWYWYYNASPAFIGNAASTNNARVVTVTPGSSVGSFNAILESCSAGCPLSWWYYGLDINGVLAQADNNDARVVAASYYNGLYVFTLIGNIAPSNSTACDNKGCISKPKLAANIGSVLQNKVVGYSVLVGGVPQISGGKARTSKDTPSLAMAPNLITNIASVSKTITAVAILQLLAKNRLSVNTKINGYLYSDWTKGANINQLTFKHLLTHTSGFGQLASDACGKGLTYSALQTLVAGGVVASNIGSPKYGNCNFALLREIMPALLSQTLLPNGPQRAQQSSTLYENYVNKNVFAPVGIPTRQCKPPAGGGNILSYPYPATSTNGIDWGDWTLLCGGGGWNLSPKDIFKVVNNLANGNTLLTPAQRKQMSSECLGWDCVVAVDKNGFLTNGAGINVWTYAGIVKCNVPVVVVVNSPLPSPYTNIFGLVKKALEASKVAGTGNTCT